MNREKIMNGELTFAAAMMTALLCMFFGTNTVAIKVALRGFGPFTIAGLRFALASLALFCWAMASGKKFRIARAQTVPLVILSMGFVIQLSIFHFGMSLTDASRASLIINLQPFLVLLLAHFFIPGERATVKKGLGMVLGFAGVSVIFAGSAGSPSGVRNGDLLVLCSTVIWGVVTVYTKRVIHGFDPFQIVFYPMVFSFPIFLLEGYLWDPVMVREPDLASLVSMVYQGLVTGAFGFIAWNTLLKRYGAVSIHSFIFLSPVAGVGFSALLLGEKLSSDLLLSLALVAAGIIIPYLRTGKSVADEPEEEVIQESEIPGP